MRVRIIVQRSTLNRSPPANKPLARPYDVRIKYFGIFREENNYGKRDTASPSTDVYSEKDTIIVYQSTQLGNVRINRYLDGRLETARSYHHCYHVSKFSGNKYFLIIYAVILFLVLSALKSNLPRDPETC